VRFVACFSRTFFWYFMVVFRWFLFYWIGI